MYHKGIVNIDEEGYLLIPRQQTDVHPLQLCCCIDVGLKLWVLVQCSVVYCLAVGSQVLVIQSENDLSEALCNFRRVPGSP